MRMPFIAGNWKMHMTVGQALELVGRLAEKVAAIDDVTVAVCPPFTALHTVGQAIRSTNIAMGAQDMYWKDKGAYTGMMSPIMLKDVGCKYVIVGHSERRGRFGTPEEDMTEQLLAVFGDNDATVNKKACHALEHGLHPIVCCGELLAERRQGRTDHVVQTQIEAALAGITEEQMARVIIAYEPVWAINTGEVCEAEEADRVCRLIRQAVAGLYTPAVANAAIIQYGGSVKPENIEGLIEKQNIDGALVGGASLSAEDFTEIVKKASKSG
jgi:triosephosphate isomerase